ncbi:MAG: glycosyltransferase [Actinomycetota bacterium]
MTTPTVTRDRPVFEVPIVRRDAERLRSIAGAEAGSRYDSLVRTVRATLRGHTVWQINATAEGGGVAELLRSCLGYLADDGIATRWLVIDADPAFFDITKRIHNRLHGELGDGGPLGPEERAHYDEVTRTNLRSVRTLVAPGDVVVVHDPQPLGLVPGLVAAGATVVWTCHVGIDMPNAIARSAWDFLRDDVLAAHAVTFTRGAYAWQGLDADRVHVVPPCIDDASRKNVALDPEHVESIVRSAGLLDHRPAGAASFLREDGSPDTIVEQAEVTEMRPTPPDAPLVVQVSRWDALKDPIGVMRGFADDPSLGEAHLMLAGPRPASVADDPEADAVLAEVLDVWRRLPTKDRSRVHIANLPTDDVEANAIIVNALQRRADVVVQKSLAEGFGLTVTEAMWKERPIVASAVGGIRDQIRDGVHGLLVHPRDLTAFGNAVHGLLADPRRAAQLGTAARQRVETHSLPTHYLGAYLTLFDQLR